MHWRADTLPAPVVSRPQRPSLIDRLRTVLPPEPPAPPVQYTAGLVAYVVGVCAVALAVATLTVRTLSDVPLLAVGAVAIVGLDLMRVRSIAGLQSSWSPSVFVHLALTLAVGAAGALTAAVAGSVATSIRLRTGWLRVAFNLADFFLANMAALAVFRLLRTVSHNDLWTVLAAGSAIGVATWTINYAILNVALRLDTGAPIIASFRDASSVVPSDIEFGMAASVLAISIPANGVAFLLGGLALVAGLQSRLLRIAHHVRERIELLRRVITAAEDERFKTASDLHDGPVAHLSGLAMTLSAIAQIVGDARIEEVADALREVLRELRTQIFALSPHDLDRPARLREEVEAKQLDALRSRGAEVVVSIPDTLPLDRAGLELVHRACREALSNVIRHAQAEHVDVAIAVQGAEVVLTINDDGRGFTVRDVERQRAQGHFGTRFLAEKAEALGGGFYLESNPGAGTSLTLRLPVAPS
jgi:signal transduction histidine kinase